MKKLLIILSIFVFGINMDVQAQKGKKPTNEPIVDEKKMAKANKLIEQAMAETNTQKKNDKIREANELFKDMKMIKEGAIIIGDAYYSAGDLQTASRWYAKGGKENKKDLSKKVGEAYLEDALKAEDSKSEQKNMTKAFQSLSKSVGPVEANRLIGNEYFDMGKEYYPKALEYYQKAGYNEGIVMIADLYSTKPETRALAAQTYVLTKEKKGYKKAGDLYFNQGDYLKAMEFYAQGGVMEGYAKYAAELKKAGKTEQMNIVYNVIADTLIAKGTPDDVYSYALAAEKENNYVLASDLYKKLNDKDLHLKYKAYQLMMSMNYLDAKKVWTEMSKTELTDAVDMNIKELTNLQQNRMMLEEFKRNAPKLSVKEDPNSGKVEYDQRDLKLREQYYSNPVIVKGISETVYKVSADYTKMKGNGELKDLVKAAFLNYSPIKNLLDNFTLAKKVTQTNVTPSLVTF